MFMMRILSSFIEIIGIWYDWPIAIDDNQGEMECNSLYDLAQNTEPPLSSDSGAMDPASHRVQTVCWGCGE